MNETAQAIHKVIPVIKESRDGIHKASPFMNAMVNALPGFGHQCEVVGHKPAGAGDGCVGLERLPHRQTGHGDLGKMLQFP